MNNNLMFSSNSNEWTTPKDLFEKLNKEFNFNVDLCASETNHLLPEYYTENNTCFNADLKGKRVFVNPPYSHPLQAKIIKFCASCNADIVVMLIPARTDTKAFHEYIYNKPNVEIRFIKGRLKFGNSKNPAPFPSMIVIFRKEKNENEY